MTTAIVARTYERARVLARELGIDDARPCSAAAPGAMVDLRVSRWLIEAGTVALDSPLLACIQYNARKTPGGAPVHIVELRPVT